MYSFLLVVIYLSFISLGLPDSLLGSAWPVMQVDLGMPGSYAGIISMIITGGTVISSLLSSRLVRRLGTGGVTFVSVLMTAVSLLGFALSSSFVLLCLLAVPLGLGAGSVDAALNQFAAVHYKAAHMNWLHCFWGIGASAGPMIMALCLGFNGGWRRGYGVIGVIQLMLVVVLFASLTLWRRAERADVISEEPVLPVRDLLKKPGTLSSLAGFTAYSAIELSTGLWGSSFLVQVRGLPPELAASWIALFYMGITLGRLLGGFLTVKLSDRQLIWAGEGILLVGLVVLHFGAAGMLAGAFFLIGMGCAPIYPSRLHQTPEYYGIQMSQAMMGIQMASAYIGSTFIPPLFGVLADRITLSIFPAFLLVMLVLMAFSIEGAHRSLTRKAV